MFAIRPLESIGDRSAQFGGRIPWWRGCCWVVLGLAAFATPLYGETEGDDEAPSLALVEAVRLALQNDPEIRLVETRIEDLRGTTLSAAGAFDPVITSSLSGDDSRTPLEQGANQSSESLEARLGWLQRLRSGQTLEPQVTVDRAADSASAVNTATVSFALRQPLLRGRNPQAVQAFERSVQLDLQAARFDLAHLTSQRLLAVVSQYWTVKASRLDLDILQSTEASSRALLETTRRLIEAQLTPAAELVQLEADLVLREANRVVGERNLFAALQQLGNEMGLTAEQIAALQLPADPFPTVDPDEVPRAAVELLETAHRRRADLAADRQRLLAEERRLIAADDALQPRLDVVLTPSYTGLVEGNAADDFLSSLWTQVPGASVAFGIELTLPLGRRVAAGDEVRARAAVDQRALEIERDSKRIDSRVPAALEAVRRNAERLEKLEQAVGLFERTVDNEEKKLRAGTSTLIDVISQRDRLTAALQSRNAAQLALAIALAELRFETGTLIDTRPQPVLTLRSDDFITLPPSAPTPRVSADPDVP